MDPKSHHMDKMAESRRPPAVNVIESEEFVQYISPDLLSPDYGSLTTQIYVASVSFVFFVVVFLVCFLLLTASRMFGPHQLKHKVFTALTVSRGMFGVLAIAAGCFFLFTTTNLDRDVVFGRSASSAVVLYFSLGFFAFEFTSVIISDITFQTFSKLLIAHHTLGLASCLVTVYFEAGYIFTVKGMFLEMSTPFSGLSFVLIKAGMENSALWRINQLVLIHTFHLRNMFELYLWYVIITNFGYIASNMPAVTMVTQLVFLAILTFVMTPYWGLKKTQQFFNPIDWNLQDSRRTESRNGSVINKND